MKNLFVTITGLNHYLGTSPFKVGRIVKLTKEEDNIHDSEAIRVDMPYLDTVGYVANSVYTVYQGTCSAGRIYEQIDKTAFAQVMFITHSSAIARIVTKEEAFDILSQEDDFFSSCKTKKNNSEPVADEIKF